MDMELRRRYEHLSDNEIAAAALMEVVGHLLRVSSDIDERGEDYPLWLEECQGLLRHAFEHLRIDLTWEEFVLGAALGLGDLHGGGEVGAA